MNPAEKLLANDPASRMLDIKLVSKCNDSCSLEMKVREDMTNGYDVCHGGFVFTLADTASAFACAAESEIVLSANNQIEYLAPALLKDRLLASAKISCTSGRSLFCDVEVVDQNSQIIAIMRGKLIRKTQEII